jgi:hypothetical protein
MSPCLPSRPDLPFPTPFSHARSNKRGRSDKSIHVASSVFENTSLLLKRGCATFFSPFQPFSIQSLAGFRKEGCPALCFRCEYAWPPTCTRAIRNADGLENKMNGAVATSKRGIAGEVLLTLQGHEGGEDAETFHGAHLCACLGEMRLAVTEVRGRELMLHTLWIVLRRARGFAVVRHIFAW